MSHIAGEHQMGISTHGRTGPSSGKIAECPCPPSDPPPQTINDLELVQGVSGVHPLILCYAGSDDAKYAIAQTGRLFPGGRALVLTVWQPISNLASVTWSGTTVMPNEADGPIWETIVETAERQQVALIAMGSRGRMGLRSLLLGSVSGAVAHHARRPILIIHRPGETD